jgi:hypothetical protein
VKGTGKRTAKKIDRRIGKRIERRTGRKTGIKIEKKTNKKTDKKTTKKTKKRIVTKIKIKTKTKTKITKNEEMKTKSTVKSESPGPDQEINLIPEDIRERSMAEADPEASEEIEIVEEIDLEGVVVEAGGPETEEAQGNTGTIVLLRTRAQTNPKTPKRCRSLTT